MVRLAVVVWMLLSAGLAQATTYYIDDNGNDSNAGTSTGAPWKTWSYAFSHSTCGDTLIVRDGTYTSANGAFNLTKSCTASTVYTISAENERAAYIDGSPGTIIPIMIQNSAYITVEGLRARSGDKTPSTGGVNTGVCNAYTSNHITFRHMICSHPNRYRNAGHVIQFYNTSDSLVEENEIYYFHRHGIYIGGGSSRNVVRRNYCHPRDYPDLSGSEVENPVQPGLPLGGDDCVLVYPGSDNVIENNIAEGGITAGIPGKCYAIEAINTSVNNKFLGNICLNAGIGAAFDARNNGASITYMPRDTVIEHMAVIGNQTVGFRFEGNKNTICRHCSAFGPGASGFEMTSLSCCPGDGQRSGYVYNSLATGLHNTSSRNGLIGTGFYVTSLVQTWSYENSTSFGNTNNYNPSSHANYNLPDNPYTTDPQMGTCKVWRPDGSNAKLNNQGADILYRYQNGVLTNTPLWDTTTGEFPHGAIVVGVNDIAGSSPFDVHTRLNVNSGGCSFPSGYGSEPTPQTTITQVRFRVEEFNSPEVGPRLKAAENTNYTVQVGGCARIRFKIMTDGSVSAGPRGFVLWAAPNGGAYAALTDTFSNKIKFSGIGNDSVSETLTTEQMTDDQPTYTAGPIVRSSTQTIQVDLGPNYDTELIALVCIQDTAVPGTDFWDFKIRQVDPTTQTVSDLDVYSAVPRLTTKRRAAGAI